MGRATSQSQTTFEDYEGFTNKFKPKKTTDDCYTPPAVYDAVKSWACARYGIDPAKTVRPFYPGGDYESFDYSDGAVVLDNPPFSILAQIIGFYQQHSIPYFLFCNGLTALNLTRRGAGVIYTDTCLRYANGAQVNTAFATSYGDNVIETAPDLGEALKRAQKSNAPPLPHYVYPANLLTTQGITALARRGVPFAIKRADAAYIHNLDDMRHRKLSLFGGGLLLSDMAAAEKAAAEKAAAEKAAAEKAAAEKAAAIQLTLSVHERLIVEHLTERSTAND